MMNLVRTLQILAQLCRATTSAIAFIIVTIVSLASSGELLDAVLLGAIIFFTSAFGFSLNEYVDSEKDKVLLDQHVIAKGMLSKPKALVVSASALTASLFLTLLAYPTQQLFNILIVIILVFYSYINNRYGILANALVALCSSLGLLMVLKDFQWSLITASAVTFFLHIFGREIILDIHDMEADRMVGKSSFPLLLTRAKSFGVAAGFIFACIAYSIVIGIYFSSQFYIIMTVIGNILFLLGMLEYKTKMTEASYQTFVSYSRASFLISIPALLL